MIYHDILIIGGGASGIFASIVAKDFGKDIAIIESSDRIGKKILTTGNGRCNITNNTIKKPYLAYHSEENEFFHYVLDSFTVEDTINTFYSMGLPIINLEGGKMYPMSLQATSVLDILRMSLEDKNIPVYLGNKVNKITSSKKGFLIKTNSEEEFSCKSLIIATGGKSAANTGSDGSGYKLAENLGHSIITPVPALVQLKLNYKNLKALSGIKFDGKASILLDNKIIREEIGEVLFTDYGVSGPPILQLSRIASKGLNKNKEVNITIDMMPNTSKEELTIFLENHWGLFSYRSIYESFIGIINKKLIPIFLKECGISDIHTPCYQLDWKERDRLINTLKCWKFKVIDTNSFSSSQVTAGGVNTNEISPVTLESKIVKNLFFCGEIIDVDGDCGGFNLQWAWSSAAVVAKSI
ncbi:NAD(P)/FAD-dependent oxidoreductase [Clostridium amazonitimonense]|uniref:NAD(P)/FAD-dependent oxidoreductase n=1 Tax=Clostridium amazonitimonense TaxID=1499689 RepID=UPI0005099EA2|nr:NAD(P)/FAD-dependent oxidoreductase [Clostridium amazonitimonense]